MHLTTIYYNHLKLCLLLLAFHREKRFIFCRTIVNGKKLNSKKFLSIMLVYVLVNNLLTSPQFTNKRYQFIIIIVFTYIKITIVIFYNSII